MRILLSALPGVLMLLGLGIGASGMTRPLVGFGLFALSALASVAVLIVLMVMRVRGEVPHFAILAIVSAIPLIVVVATAAPGFRAPPINDITTDLDNPPTFVAAMEAPENAGRDMAYPSDFVAVVRDKYAGLDSLTIEQPKDVVFEQALRIAEAEPGWQIVRQDADAGTIEGVATSQLFKFKDDFVIRITEQDGGTRVDMRSKSRDGRGDLGANAARIRKYFESLSESAA